MKLDHLQITENMLARMKALEEQKEAMKKQIDELLKITHEPIYEQHRMLIAMNQNLLGEQKEYKEKNTRLKNDVEFSENGRKLAIEEAMRRLDGWSKCLGERDRYKAALEKIADPRKRHKEPNDYTELGCCMNIANEALKEQCKPLS
jgi:hypothetical protein